MRASHMCSRLVPQQNRRHPSAGLFSVMPVSSIASSQFRTLHSKRVARLHSNCVARYVDPTSSSCSPSFPPLLLLSSSSAFPLLLPTFPRSSSSSLLRSANKASSAFSLSLPAWYSSTLYLSTGHRIANA
eukprot:3899757-Rhodomonas_salina.3